MGIAAVRQDRLHTQEKLAITNQNPYFFYFALFTYLFCFLFFSFLSFFIQRERKNKKLHYRYVRRSEQSWVVQ